MDIDELQRKHARSCGAGSASSKFFRNDILGEVGIVGLQRSKCITKFRGRRAQRRGRHSLDVFLSVVHGTSNVGSNLDVFFVRGPLGRAI